MLKKLRIIRSRISTGTYGEFIEEITALARRREGSYVCVANVHMLIEAQQDDAFAKIVNAADVATPDGMPLAKAIRLLYGFRQDRVAGMDLLPDLLQVAQKQQLSVFLYGSTEQTLEKMADAAEKKLLGINICGYYSPPFRPLDEEEKMQIAERINTAAPHLVLVALGCPKQERWMAENKPRIHSCMIGLGGAFDVYAGNTSRAPKWMQEWSLEWAYRLSQEPRRLFRRYLVTNTYFIVLFAAQYMKKLIGR